VWKGLFSKAADKIYYYQVNLIACADQTKTEFRYSSTWW